MDAARLSHRLAHITYPTLCLLVSVLTNTRNYNYHKRYDKLTNLNILNDIKM